MRKHGSGRCSRSRCGIRRSSVGRSPSGCADVVRLQAPSPHEPTDTQTAVIGRRGSRAIVGTRGDGCRRRSTGVRGALHVVAASSLDPRTAATLTGPHPSPNGAQPQASSDRARPGLLWTGDLETGDLSQFQNGPWNDVGGTRPRVVTSPVRDGKYAVELGITGSTDSADGICCGSRDELLPRFPDLHEGDDFWFGFSTYLAPGFVLYPDWQLITQFKQNFDGSPPLGLYVEDGQYKVEGGFGYPAGPIPFSRPSARQRRASGSTGSGTSSSRRIRVGVSGGVEGRSARAAPIRTGVRHALSGRRRSDGQLRQDRPVPGPLDHHAIDDVSG